MSIVIEKSGILDTFQDLGRNGFRKFGVNPNGAMDKIAVRLINILLGNDENETVLEMHFPAPVIKFTESSIIALGGANFGAKVDEKNLENWKPLFIKKDSILKFTEKISGNRAYLAIKGGFEIENLLESGSTNLLAEFGGFRGRSLKENDEIQFRNKNTKANYFENKISRTLIPKYEKTPKIRITSGAEFGLLTGLSEETLLKEVFTIENNSNRMAFRMKGEPLYLLDETAMLSSAVNFGTIQLLPGGQMIILMADHQTIGGYPRIADIFSLDLPILAQLSANDQFGFDLIKHEEAEKALNQFEKDLQFLKIGCKFHSF
ncbi:MAG: biotin-dependent carboxyltransferase family protein [Aridibacter sp.]